MPQFRFSTISRADIERSQGGNTMIQAIDYDGSDHQLVTGVPGSGKTTVTIMRGERLVIANKKILIFTYQKLLTISLKSIATKELKGKINTFHKWYASVTNGRWVSDDKEDDMIAQLNRLTVIDEILIDEGQDFEEKIYHSLLPKCKQMTVGADNAQRVHESGLLAASIRMELELNRPTIPIRLEYNYRNTFEIYNFARHFMPDNERANNPILLRLMPRGNGNMPVVIQVLSDEDKFNRLRVILDDAGDKNIAILLYHHKAIDTYYDKIIAMGLSCSKHHSQSHAGENIENILVTTYKSAKGLEFQVVIMPDMHTAMNSQEKTAEHYYIGCTRAKENLYLTFTGNNLPGYFDKFTEDSYEFRPSDNGTQGAITQNITVDDSPF
jgi:DNA helicase IV